MKPANKIEIPDINLQFILNSALGYIYCKGLDSLYIGCNQYTADLMDCKTSEKL